jgi:hypothetical protein
VVVVAKLQKFSTGELGDVVGDDGVENPMELRTPYRWMISVKNNTACSDFILEIG